MHARRSKRTQELRGVDDLGQPRKEINVIRGLAGVDELASVHVLNEAKLCV